LSCSDQMLLIDRYGYVFKDMLGRGSGKLRPLQCVGAGSPHPRLIETAIGKPMAVSIVLLNV
jgi:hypothetical protein